ncbi:hypothetical protein [Nocardiopsis tropica]|uniref:Transposase n=1 Tax=Nocardiopsis tropica TaxID=109330 RepID=A0ABU7KMC6_9ACTN|nr:hypothetical protein [Nocardiopsis umidischolae]MEE2049827.1 hypothetical protein [Nocardiopsis umidischolae]
MIGHIGVLLPRASADRTGLATALTGVLPSSTTTNNGRMHRPERRAVRQEDIKDMKVQNEVVIQR